MLIIALLALFSLASTGTTTAQTGSAGIAIQPAAITVTRGEEFTLNILAAPTPGQQIDGVQVFVDYQPEFLQVINVTPGTALPSVLWAPPYFDNTTGQIRYAAGAFSRLPQSTFILATLRLKAVKATPDTRLTFVFSYETGKMTKATWEGENLTIEAAVDGKVMVGQVNWLAWLRLALFGLGFIAFLVAAFWLNRRLARRKSVNF